MSGISFPSFSAFCLSAQAGAPFTTSCTEGAALRTERVNFLNATRDAHYQAQVRNYSLSPYRRRPLLFASAWSKKRNHQHDLARELSHDPSGRKRHKIKQEPQRDRNLEDLADEELFLWGSEPTPLELNSDGEQRSLQVHQEAKAQISFDWTRCAITRSSLSLAKCARPRPEPAR